MTETLVGPSDPEPGRGPNFFLVNEDAMLRYMVWADRADPAEWIPPDPIGRDYLIMACCRAGAMDDETTRELIHELNPPDPRAAQVLHMWFLEGHKGVFFNADSGLPTAGAARAFGMAIAGGIIAPEQRKQGRLRDVSGPPNTLDITSFSQRVHPGLPEVFRKVDRTLFWGLELEEIHKGGHMVISRFIEI